MTPTTVNGTLSMKMDRPTGSSVPKRSVARTSPIKQTRLRSAMSSGSMKRPLAAMVLRMSSNWGLTPRTVLRNSLRP